MNVVYLGAGKPLEIVSDARQMMAVDQRVPLAQANLVGVACGFEPLETAEEFSSCIRHACHFTSTATDWNPATPWQLAVYAADLQTYGVVSEGYAQ